MVWISNKSGMSCVKSMSDRHIKNTLMTLEKSNSTHYFGHTKEEWINAFNNELNLRARLGNKVLSKFACLIPLLFITTKSCNNEKTYSR